MKQLYTIFLILSSYAVHSQTFIVNETDTAGRSHFYLTLHSAKDIVRLQASRLATVGGFTYEAVFLADTSGALITSGLRVVPIPGTWGNVPRAEQYYFATVDRDELPKLRTFLQSAIWGFALPRQYDAQEYRLATRGGLLWELVVRRNSRSLRITLPRCGTDGCTEVIGAGRFEELLAVVTQAEQRLQ